MNIYVGNLDYSVTEDDLRKAFEPFGKVDSVNIIKDKYTGQSKGFGFIEMPAAGEAQAAIEQLNGKELKGRTLNVNESRPKPEGSAGRGGGSKGGGRGFGSGRRSEGSGAGRGGGGRGGFGGGGRGDRRY